MPVVDRATQKANGEATLPRVIESKLMNGLRVG